MTKKRIRCLLCLAAALLWLAPCLAAPVLADEAVVTIDEDTFPDSIFRQYVKDKFDKDKDDALSAAEIADAKIVNLNNEPVETLKGIEELTGLTTLYCNDAKLTELDVSENVNLLTLRCDQNDLNVLDLRHNGKLQVLTCVRNNLTELDLSKNTELTYFDCGHNDLTELDVSSCPGLDTLDCRLNKLTKLTLGSKPDLKKLCCYSNNLSSLNVTKAPALETLLCDSNNLSELDVSHNTKLTELNCSSNNIKELDVTKLTLLNSLNADNDRMLLLDVSKNPDLKQLYVGRGMLRLDVSHNPELRTLRCRSSALQLLNVTDCPALAYAFNKGQRTPRIEQKEWHINYNYKPVKLTVEKDVLVWAGDPVPVDSEWFPDKNFRQYVRDTFDGDGDGALSASELKNAKTMDCSGNGIRDLGGLELFTFLQRLDCSGNELSELNVNNNAALTELDCSGNQIERIDVRAAGLLGKLACQDNMLSELDLGCSRILTDVVLNSDRELAGGVETYRYNGRTLSFDNAVRDIILCGQPEKSVSITSRNFPDSNFKKYVRGFDINKDGFLSEYERSMAGEIKCADMGIKSLEGINYFSGLGGVDCSGNELYELDINIAPLSTLNCSNNELRDLHLDCFALQELNCSGNNLTELNLEKTPYLNDSLKNGTMTESGGVCTYTYSGSKLIVDTATELGADGVPITEKYFPDEAFRTFILENIDRNENKRLDPDEADRGYILLDISGKGIASLTGLSYFRFERLDCSDNKLTELDLSIFPELDKVYCSNNQLKTLTLGSNDELNYLACEHNELAELDLSGCLVLNDAVRYRTFTDHYNDDEHGPYSHYGTTTGDITVDDKTKLRVNEHDLVPVEAVEPTYADSGNLAHYRCTDCGKLFGDPYGEEEITNKDVYLPRLGVDVTDAHKNVTEKVLEVTLDRERYDEIRLILAQYDKNGRLVSVSIKTVKDTLSQYIMPMPAAAHFRVMVTDKDNRPMGISYYE